MLGRRTMSSDPFAIARTEAAKRPGRAGLAEWPLLLPLGSPDNDGDVESSGGLTRCRRFDPEASLPFLVPRRAQPKPSGSSPQREPLRSRTG